MKHSGVPRDQGLPLPITIAACALLVPLMAMAAPAVIRWTAVPAEPASDRFDNQVNEGVGRVWCRNGVFIPTPSGKSYACPFGGEFRCEAPGCQLFSFDEKEKHWNKTVKNGLDILIQGETKRMDRETWYGARSGAPPGMDER